MTLFVRVVPKPVNNMYFWEYLTEDEPIEPIPLLEPWVSECLHLQLQLSSIFWPASFIFLFVIDYNGLAGMGECEFERPFEGVEWSKLLSM